MLGGSERIEQVDTQSCASSLCMSAQIATSCISSLCINTETQPMIFIPLHEYIDAQSMRSVSIYMHKDPIHVLCPFL